MAICASTHKWILRGTQLLDAKISHQQRDFSIFWQKMRQNIAKWIRVQIKFHLFGLASLKKRKKHDFCSICNPTFGRLNLSSATWFLNILTSQISQNEFWNFLPKKLYRCLQDLWVSKKRSKHEFFQFVKIRGGYLACESRETMAPSVLPALRVHSGIHDVCWTK